MLSGWYNHLIILWYTYLYFTLQNFIGKSSTGNLDTYSIHSGYLFSNYGTAKRSRADNVPVGIAHPNLYIGEDTQSFLKPKTLGTDERQWTHLHEAADSTLPISLPVCIILNEIEMIRTRVSYHGVKVVKVVNLIF